jgi:hypothetical protein
MRTTATKKAGAEIKKAATTRTGTAHGKGTTGKIHGTTEIAHAMKGAPITVREIPEIRDARATAEITETVVMAIIPTAGHKTGRTQITGNKTIRATETDLKKMKAMTINSHPKHYISSKQSQV